jgi:hypothetical protein
MVNQIVITFQKTLKRAQGCVIFCNQNPRILIVMFVALNLRYGAMKTKQPVAVAVLNGLVLMKMQLAYHTANMQTNAEQ